MRPVTSPRRRVLAMNSSVPPPIVSSACSQPSRPPTNRCMMPSVDVHLAPGVRVPADELRDVLEAVLGEEAQQLELGIDPGLEPSEDLEDQLFVEHDRRVRLLGTDRARLAPLAGEPGDRGELDHSVCRRQP